MPFLSAVWLSLVGAAGPALPASSAAQQDTTRILIAGTIIDPLRQPVEGAEIFVVGGTARVTSSAAGTFRLYAPRGKEVLLQVRRPGYNSQLLKLAEGWSGTILLQPGAFKLPDVKVTARYAKPVRYAATAKYDDFFRRQRFGFGQFLTRDDIDRRAPIRTVDLLEGRAGIRVDSRAPGAAGGTVVAFARCHEFPPKINVYLDGRKVNTRSQFTSAALTPQQQLRNAASTNESLDDIREIAAAVGEVLDRINPSDIEMVEIFRGPGELPGEYSDGNCGAIGIWTRWAGR